MEDAAQAHVQRGGTTLRKTRQHYASRIDALRTLGADQIIDYNKDDFTKIVSGVDAVFDKSTEIDALMDYCARQCFRQAETA